MSWWWTIGAFVCGAFVGWMACFVWVAERLGPAIDRAEKRISYRVRHDDFARNDYRSEL